MLSFLSYNISPSGSYRDGARIISYIIDKSFDIVALQQVRRRSYEFYLKNLNITDTYAYLELTFINERERKNLLLIKKFLYPILDNANALITLTTTRFPGDTPFPAKIYLSDVYLTSPKPTWGTTASTSVKCDSLNELAKSLPVCDAWIVLGDFNFVDLPSEIECTNNLKLVDIAKSVGKMDPTWDPVNNSKALGREMVSRPDRAYALARNCHVDILNVYSPRLEYSGHYPLEVSLKFSSLSLSYPVETLKKLEKEKLTAYPSNRSEEEIANKLEYLDKVNYIYRRRVNFFNREFKDLPLDPFYQRDLYGDDNEGEDNEYDSDEILIKLGSDEIAVDNFFREFLMPELPDYAMGWARYLALTPNYDAEMVKGILRKLPKKVLVNNYLHLDIDQNYPRDIYIRKGIPILGGLVAELIGEM